MANWNESEKEHIFSSMEEKQKFKDAHWMAPIVSQWAANPINLDSVDKCCWQSS